MFQGRFLDLCNALLEDIVDVRVHVNILEGSNGLYHQNQQLFQVEDTLLQIQLQDCQPGVSLIILFPNLPPGDCWPGCIMFIRFQIVGQVCSLLIRFQMQPTGGAACLYGFKTYLTGTDGLRCSQFIRFLNHLRNVF